MHEVITFQIVYTLHIYSPVWHCARVSNEFKSTLFKLFESHFPIADVIFMLNYTETIPS